MERSRESKFGARGIGAERERAERGAGAGLSS